MELWNCRNLKPPPVYTYAGQTSPEMLNELKNALLGGINFFNDQRYLTLETALLSRIIYRMKTKMRHEKDFKMLEKVKRPLILLFEMDIVRVLNVVLRMCRQERFSEETVFPTKNMIDYVLVRLQGLGKLMCRIVEMSKEAAKMYEARLRLGHFWQIGFILIALLGRIFVLSLNVIKFTCHLYQELLFFSKNLENAGGVWLPNGYKFPENLKAWLEIEWAVIQEFIDITEDEVPIFDLAEDSDNEVEVCDDYIEVSDDEDLEIINEFRSISSNRIKRSSLKKSLRKSLLKCKENENTSVYSIEDSVLCIDEGSNKGAVEMDIPSDESKMRRSSVIEISNSEGENTDDVVVVGEGVADFIPISGEFSPPKKRFKKNGKRTPNKAVPKGRKKKYKI